MFDARALGQSAACQRETLPRLRLDLSATRTGNCSERGSGKKTSPSGVQVVAKQRVEEAVDTVKGKWLTHRRHGMGPERR